MKGGNGVSNILIVDDSLVDRSIISKIIKKNVPEAVIYESDDGMNVEQTLRNDDIMLCILDLRMPKRDGVDILSTIKSDAQIMDIPVIICSAIMDTETLSSVLSLGAYDYFTKPLSEEVMKIALPLKVKNAIELSKRTKYIIELSQIDALTGLYNRHFFKSHLAAENLKGNAEFAMLMADINGLKLVNDAFGSDYGDRYMVEVSRIIKEIMPRESVCARWGGDEFAILIPGADRKRAEQYAAKIRKQFARTQTAELSMSLAFGWDSNTDRENDLFKLLTNAEDAMIRDKILESESTRSSMIIAILHTLHEKNPREEAHSRRVSELCYRMGVALGLSDKELHDLKVIGLLHDIGKIAIDENILNKPGKLVYEEWLEIKRHPEIGHRILSGAPEMREYAHIILCHHERPDGKGYPNGLYSEDIPLYSKLVSIIDSYDAMTCERPYRKTLSAEDAAEELIRHSGTQFDGDLVKLFVEKVIPEEFSKNGAGGQT
jgi:diguanylate cyclase (GGDEF)-like protein